MTVQGEKDRDGLGRSQTAAPIASKQSAPAALSDAALDERMELAICGWNGNPQHCVYLNDFRIVGGKPWGGGTTTKRWNVTLRDLIRAVPALQELAGLDYLGQPLSKAQESSVDERDGAVGPSSGRVATPSIKPSGA